MKRYFFLLIFIVACKPKAVIHEYKTTDGEFIKVFADLYIAEQVVRSTKYDKDSLMIQLKDQIFEIHGIKDTIMFNQEMKILMNDQQKYEMINDSVISKLDKMKELNKNK